MRSIYLFWSNNIRNANVEYYSESYTFFRKDRRIGDHWTRLLTCLWLSSKEMDICIIEMILSLYYGNTREEFSNHTTLNNLVYIHRTVADETCWKFWTEVDRIVCKAFPEVDGHFLSAVVQYKSQEPRRMWDCARFSPVILREIFPPKKETHPIRERGISSEN